MSDRVSQSLDDVPFLVKVALDQLAKRKAANAGKGIDNSLAYAGSPMHYFCRFCDAPTETLPELHTSVPVMVCHPCKLLHDLGLV